VRYVGFILEEWDNLPDVMVCLHAGAGDWHDAAGGGKLQTLLRWHKEVGEEAEVGVEARAQAHAGSGTKASSGGGRRRQGFRALPANLRLTVVPGDNRTARVHGGDAGAGAAVGMAAGANEQGAARPPLLLPPDCIPGHGGGNSASAPPPLPPFLWANYFRALAVLTTVWPDVFQPFLGELPAYWVTPCCGQFVVERDAVRRLPREFYQRLFDWLVSGECASFDAGLVLEFTWALVFNMDGARRAAAASPWAFVGHPRMHFVTGDEVGVGGDSES
jgi:hypothetical protein